MSCTLCSLELPKNPIREKENAFCCLGCLTVFTIIGAHENYVNHPLFQEALKAGVISNPDLSSETKQEETAKDSLKFHLQLDGLWCPSCAEAIRMILLRQKGIMQCLVDYATDMAIITINPFVLSKQQVIECIHKLGYKATELLSEEKKEIDRSLWLRLGVAIFCAMNIMMFSYPLYAAHFGISTEGYEQALGWLSFILTLPIITYSAWPIWKRFSVSLKSRLFGMETLVFIGVMTAFTLSSYHLYQGHNTNLYFDSLSMVLCFVLLGKILEKKAKFSAKDTLLKLTHYLPKKAYKRLSSGEYAYVPIKEIASGDILFVRTGEKIVLDGEVLDGSGLVDETIMTGESVPLQKTKGCIVVGGSLVKQGNLTLKVTQDRAHSLLGQIVILIEQDLMKKNSTENIVNKITRYFVPGVICLAIMTFCLYGAIRSLTLLLISCPCALGIAVPLVYSRLFFRFAQHGALVRNRNRIALLGRNPQFVFDKTGTLTEGQFRVLKGMDHLSSANAAILKAMVSKSNHPVSVAIADALFCAPAHLESVEEIVGCGIKGKYQSNDYILGSARFLREKGLDVELTADALAVNNQDELTTIIYFAKNHTLLTEIHLGDRLRSCLPKLDGVILSGDSSQLVKIIAKKCGFLWGKGNMNPMQKRDEILALKKNGRPVVMVGDGVNDAPAMTAADLGISVVSATDLAVEVSDILLTTENLDALPKLCALTKKCQKIIYQNLFWAFFYNSVAILCAFLGLLNPLIAAIAMVMSSLCVTYNSYRLK